MFSHWTKMSLCKMSYYFKSVDYQRGHAVFNEGDKADHIYIVVAGDFMLTKKVKGKRTAAEIVILGPGELAGTYKNQIHDKRCICSTQTG